MIVQPDLPSFLKPGAPSALDWALFYLRRGLCVIPVWPQVKKPHVRWTIYQTRLPTEAEVIGWWQRWPHARVGIVTGMVSGGLVVLDVDPRHQGHESIKGLPLPPTPSVMSGRGDGGFHSWLKSRTPLRKSQGFLPGVDLQAEGAFVVLPPSLHQDTGRPYEWADGLGLDDIEIAPVPDWIMAKAKAFSDLPKVPPISTVIAPDALVALGDDPVCIETLEQAQTIAIGQRNLATMNFLGYLRSRGVPIEAAIQRVEAMIRRLPSHVSATPVREQLESVARVASAVYGVDGRYTFHCRYLVAMGMPCAGAACPLYEIAGRPRNPKRWRKVSDEPLPQQESLTLEEARLALDRDLRALAQNPDGKVHIFRVEVGVGKTVAAARALLPRGTIWMAAMHKQLNEPEKIAEELGVRYCRFPQLSDENCISARVVNEHLKRGIAYTQVVCPGCERRNSCAYLQSQKPGDSADSILLVQKYHEVPTFYGGHENHKRLFVVFDEDPMSVWRPERRITTDGLHSYRTLVQRVLDHDPRSALATIPGIVLPDLMLKETAPFARANLEVQMAMVDRLLSDLSSGRRPQIPDDLARRYRPECLDNMLEAVYDTLKAGVRRKNAPLFTSYAKEIHELLTGAARGIAVGDRGLAFHVCLPPPRDKTIIVLDATATVEDMRIVLGDREIVEHSLPPVFHSSRIVQVLDSNWSRQSVVWDTMPRRLEGGAQSRPRRLLARVLAKIEALHPNARFGVITHKDSIPHVQTQLPRSLNPILGHFSGQRGSNEFADRDVLIVIGSPKINPEAIQAKAVSLCGRELPHEEMIRDWRRVQGSNGTFEVEVLGYKSPEMQTAYRYCVTRELLQAVGRARYVFGGKTVYLITNEPLEDKLPVEFVALADLLGPNAAPRSDSTYPKVLAVVRDRFSRGETVGIADVLTAVPGVARQTLSTHLSRAAEAVGGVHQGRRWALRPSGLA